MTNMEEIFPNYRWQWPSKTGIYQGTDESQIALTFDDGPNDIYTLKVLDVLAKHQVKATFFVVGKYVKQRPEIVRRVYEAGHLVANHTETHRNLDQVFAPTLIMRELEICQKAVEDAIGATPRYFRPPFGRCPAPAEQAAEQLGLRVVMWSVIPEDYDAAISTERIEKRVRLAVSSRSQGEIVLLHDGDGVNGIGADRQRTVDATEKLIAHFIARGKKFVSLNEFRT